MLLVRSDFNILVQIPSNLILTGQRQWQETQKSSEYSHHILGEQRCGKTATEVE